MRFESAGFLCECLRDGSACGDQVFGSAGYMRVGWDEGSPVLDILGGQSCVAKAYYAVHAALLICNEIGSAAQPIS